MRSGRLRPRLVGSFVAVALVGVATLGLLVAAILPSQLSRLVVERQDQAARKAAETLGETYRRGRGWTETDLAHAGHIAATADGAIFISTDDPTAPSPSPVPSPDATATLGPQGSGGGGSGQGNGPGAGGQDGSGSTSTSTTPPSGQSGTGGQEGQSGTPSGTGTPSGSPSDGGLGIGHLEDARILAQRKGLSPDVWQDVKLALPGLADPQTWPGLNHGFARGHEAMQFVDSVRNFQDILARVEPRDDTLPPRAVPAPQGSTKGAVAGR